MAGVGARLRGIAIAGVVALAGGGMVVRISGGPAGGASFARSVASASLVNQAGAAVGTVNFQQVSADKVRVRAVVSGLDPSSDFHGFHIHANGACTGDFVASAGGHWNPGASTHGDHQGDLPVLYAGGDGTARASFTTDAFTVDQLLNDAGGVAVIVHAGRDNYANIPARYSTVDGPGPDATTNNTGDAGGRYACGVVRAGAAAMAAVGAAGGYWTLASDGGVFAHGDAGFFGRVGLSTRGALVAMVPAADRAGYYLADAGGGVFALGSAAFAGSLGGVVNQPVVGIATPPSHAKAGLRSQAGADVGAVTFTQVGGRVRANVVVMGLTPAAEYHGFHIHTNGACSGDFVASAGGHWNPGATDHGDHQGDLPSVYADASGTARATAYLDSFTVAQLLADPGGVAVIVHAGRDNYANIPARYSTVDGPGADATTRATGDAGGRYACGVVAATGGTSGPGYWLAAADGGVFALGDAPFLGSMAGRALSAPIVGIVSTPTGDGYWLVGRDGAVYAFGDAVYLGRVGATAALNAPIVAVLASPTGQGYLLVAADGGVFSFGDTSFEGSAGSITLNRPIVGAAATETGHGYWLFAADGGVFDYGDAEFAGSEGGRALVGSVVAGG